MFYGSTDYAFQAKNPIEEKVFFSTFILLLP